MALWGNNDSKETKGSDGSVGLITNFNYSASAHGYDALTLFGSNTQFGETGHAGEGDVIRIGRRGAGITKYMGDVVVVSVATTMRVSVASSASLVGTAVTNMSDSKFLGTSFTVSEMPIFATQDLQGDRYRNTNSSGTATAAPSSDSLVYGISTAAAGQAQATSTSAYYNTNEGWVGITTYLDNGGNLRVKSEILVAMSGIATAGVGTGIPYPTTQA